MATLYTDDPNQVHGSPAAWNSGTRTCRTTTTQGGDGETVKWVAIPNMYSNGAPQGAIPGLYSLRLAPGHE